jgi:hypothetical protein
MDEEWRDVKGYEGLYQVSSLGRVKSLNYRRSGKEKVLSTTHHPDGYIRSSPFAPDKRTIAIHRLVAQSFIPNPLNKPEVHHKNGKRDDNRLSNLMWATREEQQLWTKNRESRGGERNIKVRYDVVIRRKGQKSFHKSCDSMEEAIRIRDEWYEVNEPDTKEMWNLLEQDG